MNKDLATDRNCSTFDCLICKLVGSSIPADDCPSGACTTGLSGKPVHLLRAVPWLVCWSLALVLAHKDHVVFSREKSFPLAELARCL